MTKNRSTKKAKSESILQTEKECYMFRRMYNRQVTNKLEKHHIYAGKNRANSEKHGFWVWLSPIMHRESNQAVHGRDGANMDLFLKQECQAEFEKTHTREEFRSIIGRSYL